MPKARSLEPILLENLSALHALGQATKPVRRALEEQREQAILWVPVFFACGIGAYFSLPFEPPLWTAIFILLLLSSGCVLLYRARDHSQSARTVLAILTACIIAASGFAAAKIRTLSVDTPILEKKISRAYLTGTIESLETLPGKQGSRAVLTGVTIEKLSATQTPRKIRIQIRKDENLWAGQKLKIFAQLNPPSDPVLPGGYNFRRAMYFQGIGAVGFAYTEPEIMEESTSLPGIEALRQKLAKTIQAALPGPEAPIIVAITVGQKKGISEEDEESLRNAGLAHLLAISGLHVGLVAGIIFFSSRFLMALIPALALRWPIKKIAAIMAFCVAFLFMLVAGGTIPTQRAVLMISIVFLAVLIDRVAISLRLLAFAAMVVLVIAPESLLSASFQMSFAAVAALIAAYEAGRKLWARTYANAYPLKRAAVYFLGISFTSVIASAATAPISAYHFQQVALYGIIANLTAIPLMAFLVMPASVLAFILMPLGLEGWPLGIAGWGVTKILETARFTASLPGAVISSHGWPFPAFLLIIASGLVLVLWRGVGKALAIPLVLCAVGIIITGTTPDIMIAAQGRLAAYRGQGGMLYATTIRSEKFTLENWERYNGVPQKSTIAFALETAPQYLQKQNNENDDKLLSTELQDAPQCDPQACRVTLKGKKISFVRQPYAQKTECAWADILIIFDPLEHKPCAAATVIDKFTQWRYGAHALAIDDKQGMVILRTREAEHLSRPWDISRPARKTKNVTTSSDQES